MKKEIQTIFIVLTFSIAAAARLSILGWLIAIGIGSVLIFGIAHFIIHFYAMNYLATKGKKNGIKIILSHLLFLSIFLFQFDFDDSRSYSVIGHVFGIRNSFLESDGILLVGIALIGYIMLSIIMIRSARKEKLKGKNTKFLIPAIVISLLLSFFLIFGF